ncbi:MAG: hypothetical protein GY859_07655, partial [Desulfobacterales bacterium]|nr:hypothetical protein [Desulfobacterales bacterium]
CGEFTSAPLEETEEEKKRCPLCKSLETLAGEAARAQYLGVRPGVAGEEEAGERLTHYKDVLSALGCEYDFREKSVNPGEELRLNNVAFLGPDKSFLGFRFMAKHGPLAHGGGMLTLEDLAMEATGVKKWGVLRADVDDLGWTFRRGLGEANQGMARISGLSHLMSLYFSAHIQRLAEQTPFRRGVSLVYSGGDDLFIIGSWSMLPDLARRIQAGFSRFTSGRLRLSAGVFLAPTTGFPVHQAAEMAGVEEDLAKSAGKDRISIFESPTPWSSFRELADIKDKLVGLLVNRCPRALLTILYAGWEEQRLYLKKEIPMFRVWRLLYAIQRLTERNRRLGPALTVLKTRVVKNLRMPDHCNVAIRWAEFYTHK